MTAPGTPRSTQTGLVWGSAAQNAAEHLVRTPIDQAPVGRTLEFIAAGDAQLVEHAVVGIDRTPGDCRIAEVGGVDELVGRVFNNALRSRTRSVERRAQERKLEGRRRGDEVAGNTASRITGSGHVITLVGDVNEFTFRLNHDLDGVGQRGIVRYDAAGLGLERPIGADREGQNLARISSGSKTAAAPYCDRLVVKNVNGARHIHDRSSRLDAEGLRAVLAERELATCAGERVGED